MALKNIQRHHIFISFGHDQKSCHRPDKRRIPCSFLSAGWRRNALSSLQNFGYYQVNYRRP
ncbi:hypothetical protein KCP74_13450 [Salmonella enterica subsp. enterica]|nr:hypothetical protein KCP74_13450 [Salmonella enterica subsp. enterica]